MLEELAPGVTVLRDALHKLGQWRDKPAVPVAASEAASR
jgi:hypothetical protein